MSLFLIKFERVFSQWKKSNLSQTIATEFARKARHNSTSTIHIYMKAQPKKILRSVGLVCSCMKPVEKGDIFHLCHVYLCSLKHFGFMFIMNRFCGRNRKLPLNFRILRLKYKLLNIGTFKKISRL